MNLWKWLLCLSIASSRPPSPSGTHIYQTVDGTIGSTKIEFTLFVNDFKGVIVQMFDSHNNQLGVEIIKSRSEERNISLRFINAYRAESLSKTCGCSPCEDTMVHIIISFDGGLTRLRCNGRGHIDLYKMRDTLTYIATGRPLVLEGNGNKVYPMPAAVANGSQKTLIMIGNRGPYQTGHGSTVYPEKVQMVGCLVTFLLGDRNITFLGGDDRVQPLCPQMCIPDVCHGGECKKRWRNDPTCDCHKTAHNGPFCNRSLAKYDRGVNSSYKVIQVASWVRMKMTWKNVVDKHFCLMEVIGRKGRATISVNKSIVFVDSEVIGHISNDGVNFVSVNISSNDLIVKINNKQSKTVRPFEEVSLINIGFSDGSNKCETFEGTYDFHFDSSQLKLIWLTTAMSSVSSVSSVVALTSNRTTELTHNFVMAFLCAVIVCFIIITVTLKLRRRTSKHIYNQPGNSTPPDYFQMDGRIHVITEEGVYVNNYHYINDLNSLYQHGT